MKKKMRYLNTLQLAGLCTLFCLFCSQRAFSESYMLSVGESITISQSAYGGGYIDNVGLADYLDPHLDFEKTWDNSAKITIKSYFDYSATVKLVFIERYTYMGHTRAATYYRDVTITCKYEKPDPSKKPKNVILPERIRIPMNQGIINVSATLEPSGAVPTSVEWTENKGTARFVMYNKSDITCGIKGVSTGVGSARVVVDETLSASTVIEIVDPNNLPPNAIFLQSKIEISVGGVCTLTPILEPKNTATTYSWKSSNENVASVSYGKVTGIREGTAIITLTTGNQLTATCEVTVVRQNGKDDEDNDSQNSGGSVGGHEYVDLGLSVKWATCNIGATSPEQYGNYYAWGETTTKSSYTWENYKHCAGSLMSCYNIGSDIKGTSYDAACVQWGNDWRMPSEAEMGELIAKCTFKAETRNGVSGFLATGPNGNSVFFPSAGYKSGTRSESNICRCWTSTVSDAKAVSLMITTKYGSPSLSLFTNYRSAGLPIRAVTESHSIPEPTPTPKLTLSVSPSGGQVSKGTTVFLTAKANGSTVTGCDIYYTLNGTTPTKSSTKYSGGLTINSSCTLKAIAYKDGYEDSNVLTATYSVPTTTKLTLSASPSGGQVSKGTTVFLTAKANGSTVTGCDIYYTLDGTYVTKSDSKYSSSGISINKDCTLRAVAYKDGYEASDELRTTYTIASVQDIEINATNFPDDNFRSWLLAQSYGKNGVLTESEIKNVTSIIVSSESIKSLKGIEYFTALTRLGCYNNQLTALDVSKNTALTRLDCYSNQLTALDVSKNTALEDLYCNNNQLTALDVSNNTALTHLDCDKNQLTALDVSKNTALKYLDCYSNQLTALDVSKNTALEYLDCSSNQLTTLDVSKNTALLFLYCFYNQLTTLDVSKNTALILLECYGNQLTALDVSKNTALTDLSCVGNQLTALDVSKNTALKNLSCSSNQLTALDVSKNTALTSLNCGGNQLTALDVSKNTALRSLYCHENQLTALDVSKNTALTSLNCGGNQLTALDVSNNTALTSLDCDKNQLTALDVLKNTALTSLGCSDNQLTALDVSKNTALIGLSCGGNQLTALDVSKNTELGFLRCYSNQLTALDVSKNTPLTVLYCYENQLTALDVSKNTALKYLDCSSNQLTALDVSNNTELENLYCYNNSIKGTDMDALIGSLPQKRGYIDIYFVVIDISENANEGNVCTKAQVDAAKAKGWIVRAWNGEESVEYEGSDAEYPVVIISTSKSGYSTFYSSESAYTLPNGLSAQVVTNTVNNKLTYKTIADGSVSGAVPKSTAVMLVSSNKQGGTFTLKPSENTTSYNGTNLLHGSDDATTTTGNGYHYKLSYGQSRSNLNNVFGWYWGNTDGAPFYIEGHKAWLVLPSSATRAGGFSVDGDVLAVGELMTEETEDGCVFDLQGRRLKSPTQKGVYVKNGRKIVYK